MERSDVVAYDADDADDDADDDAHGDGDNNDDVDYI